MTVQNTRVGQVTDYDKLTLDVYTNGTLAPDEAVSLAAKVLSEHLSLFIDLSENAKTAEVMVCLLYTSTAITRYVTVGLALIESAAMAIGFGRQGLMDDFNAVSYTHLDVYKRQKLLESAAANAENNNGMKRENLYVAECYANKGPTMKRVRPRAQGRAYRIEKRMSHITVVLDERK